MGPALRTAFVLAFALVGCGHTLERTPRAPGRIDAEIARADVPVWRPGDQWQYRGATSDARDNRFYRKVLRVALDDAISTYEVDSPDEVTFVEVRTLHPLHRKVKATGATGQAGTFNPLDFPLFLMRPFGESGTWKPHGSAPRPFELACRVMSYEDVTVHAGTFAAFRIDCNMEDGFAEHWYAPEVKNLVKMRWTAKHQTFTAELWDYVLVE
jgi:hypothetical protein